MAIQTDLGVGQIRQLTVVPVAGRTVEIWMDGGQQQSFRGPRMRRVTAGALTACGLQPSMGGTKPVARVVTLEAERCCRQRE
ncbi:MAG: hypothetical protein WBQ30_12880 [Thermoanaerobaculia bacterium]